MNEGFGLEGHLKSIHQRFIRQFPDSFVTFLVLDLLVIGYNGDVLE